MEFACSCPAAQAAWTLKPLLVLHAKPNSLHDSPDSPETTTGTKAGKGHTADKAEDKAGNASRGGRSTDQLLANILNTVATAGSSNSSDTADTAGIPDPSIDHRSKDKVHRSVLLRQGCVREAGQRSRLPRKKPSSSFCPFSSCLIRNFKKAKYMPNTTHHATTGRHAHVKAFHMRARHAPGHWRRQRDRVARCDGLVHVPTIQIRNFLKNVEPRHHGNTELTPWRPA